MKIKLEELQGREPITERLTLPVSADMLNRYRKVQHTLDTKKLRSLHSFARERLMSLLEEIEETIRSA